ncbi:hypothetical protein GBAR_LOCUS31445 [Geodia barretti]|uniref:Uncharacterized protein n=1 Tax=Geodia barretti TaxID=519541 RepID=A0AA35U2W8_GEOBA|nr:hypothetical protein GBAR_LOCUS31445 [Geodia barretti]
MSETHGYDVGSSPVLNKTGAPVDEQTLRRYKCVFCGLLLREACQMACGDRTCRVCLPQEGSIFQLFFTRPVRVATDLQTTTQEGKQSNSCENIHFRLQ